MLEMVESWAALRSVEEMGAAAREAFGSLGKVEEAPMPHGLLVRARPIAPVKVLLVGHLDTIQTNAPVKREGGRLYGQGVCDMKGGLVVMLEALKSSPKIDWTLLLVPDEEIGSPSSRDALTTLAKEHDVGLVFEPALPNGHLVSSRKGSANFTITATGKEAHAGRDFSEGKSAIHALCQLVAKLAAISDATSGITLNVGKLQGGHAINVVAGSGDCLVNIRAPTSTLLGEACYKLHTAVSDVEKASGVAFTTEGGITRPPKEIDEGTQQLMGLIEECGQEMGLPIGWEASGGVSDGNNLAAAGLPTIDTLGVVGGKMHTMDEYLEIESLAERAHLATRLLKRLENWKS